MVASSQFPPNQDADVVFESSDHVQYGLHSRNLETNTGGFPPVGNLGTGDVVSLPETSKVLNLLFAFIYPCQHPDIEDLPFDLLIKLAEAAEKYQVYAAISMCRLCLRYSGTFRQDHPVEIALFAARHGYNELLKLTAPYAIHVPLSTAIPMLPDRLIVPWLKYQEQWAACYRSFPAMWASKNHFTQYGTVRYAPDWGDNYHYCGKWKEVCGRHLQENHANASPSWSNVDCLFNINNQQLSECCRKALEMLRTEFEAKLRSLTPFAEFMLTYC